MKYIKKLANIESEMIEPIYQAQASLHFIEKMALNGSVLILMLKKRIATIQVVELQPVLIHMEISSEQFLARMKPLLDKMFPIYGLKWKDTLGIMAVVVVGLQAIPPQANLPLHLQEHSNLYKLILI